MILDMYPNAVPMMKIVPECKLANAPENMVQRGITLHVGGVDWWW